MRDPGALTELLQTRLKKVDVPKTTLPSARGLWRISQRASFHLFTKAQRTSRQSNPWVAEVF